MILTLHGDTCEYEGRFAGILGRTDEYIAVQFPGRSIYKPFEGALYEKTWICVGKIENISGDGATLTVEPILQFKLRQ
jgi:hypothetical protein